jgi:hypothetical protein
MALSFPGKPKNLPPSNRISGLEHCGLAHFEIITPPSLDVNKWQLVA